jgi:hypothetical protein
MAALVGAMPPFVGQIPGATMAAVVEVFHMGTAMATEMASMFAASKSDSNRDGDKDGYVMATALA